MFRKVFNNNSLLYKYNNLINYYNSDSTRNKSLKIKSINKYNNLINYNSELIRNNRELIIKPINQIKIILIKIPNFLKQNYLISKVIKNFYIFKFGLIHFFIC